MYSRRWSFRTLSMGWLGLATMPLRLPPFADTTKAGSLPSSGLVGRRQRYYEPLGLPPGTIPLRRRLIGTACVRRGPPGRVSPVPYQAVSTCPPLYPVGVLHPFRLQDAVCCLRRGMSGSATSPFRGLMSRGCKVHFMLGPPTCIPPDNLSTIEGPLTHHSDAKVSLTIRCLLHGASALTVTGLPPASSIQHDSLQLLSANHSGRNIRAIVAEGRSRLR